MSIRLANRVRFARALRSQPFAFLWAGQTISTLGDGAFTVALAWSIDWIGSLAFEPIGLAVIGILTDRLGPSPVFLVAGGVNAILALVGMLAVRGIRELD